jgi:hypothetical protein
MMSGRSGDGESIGSVKEVASQQRRRQWRQ